MMKEEGPHLIRVGGKPVSAYIQAINFSLDHFDKCVIRGLGKRQQKCFEIKMEAEKINGIEVEKIEKTTIEGCPALEVYFSNGGDSRK